jgi:hypothetical protein
MGVQTLELVVPQDQKAHKGEIEMIGSLVSMKLIGHKTWKESFVFWVVVLSIGLLMGFVLSPFHIAYLLTGLGFLVFIFIAHFLFQLRWIHSIATWGVALIIDWAIIYVVFYLFHFSFSWIMGG